MICLDCLDDSSAEHPAVGACTTCGAGVCLAHAVIARRPPVVGIGSVTMSKSATASREITCRVCDAAVFGPVKTRT